MSETLFRVAIVGAGPSGFYAAAALLASDDPAFCVDLYDRLPTPFGLVRAGVAPDHPKIKAVTAQYDKVAQHERFRFMGHVDVGTEVHHDELMERYHAVLYSVGTSTDRKLGIPGEDLEGSHAATEFVAWYNGHPDFGHLEFDLKTAKRVAVIGAGNVAIDVARMIALDASELEVTDTADHAIEVLKDTSVEEVVLLARRGPLQAAFTNPELIEMGELHRADVTVHPGDMQLDEASTKKLETADKTRRRNVEILNDYAGRESSGKPVTVTFRFAVSPVEILGTDGRVSAIRLEKNTLIEREDGSISAKGTGETEDLPVDLVFRSIGYRGVELPGVPFDEDRGLIRNDGGRVCDDSGTPVPGVYCAGWVKRGPSGVIGTNKKDAKDTVTKLIEDAQAGKLPEPAKDDIDALLAQKAPELVTWDGWEAIDAAERDAGAPQNRPRVKLTLWEELRAAAKTETAK